MVVLMIAVLAAAAGIAQTLLLGKGAAGKEKAGCCIKTAVIAATAEMIVIRVNPLTKHFLYLEEYGIKQYVFAFLSAFAAAAVVTLFLHVLRKRSQKAESTKAGKAVKIIGLILFFFGLALLMGSIFVYHEWNSVDPEQLMYNAIAPTVGTEIGIYLKGFEYVILTFAATAVLGIFLFSKVMPTRGGGKALIRDGTKIVMSLFLAVVVMTGGLFYAQTKLEGATVFKAYFMQSDFIEKNYVDVKTAKVTFPEKKRNIIYFYLESIENSYLSKELGGYMEENLMPELTELSYEGVTFSDNDGKFGGPMQITGTSWSLASMVNQTLGIPLKAPRSFTAYSTPQHYLAGAYGFGDLLKENGYEQEIMIGADARFGGLDNLYNTHGDYKIFDYEYAKANGYIPKDYHVWWGYEDDKLYAFAKEEITRLYETGKPFNFTFENADTHMPNGYLPEGAPKPYKSPYANAIANSTKEVVKMIRWIQEQPFYENTTIVLIGDHLSMDVDFFSGFDSHYVRTQFNLILNPAENVRNVSADRLVNRQYNNMDMLPTVLAAMGCTIEGNRLGMGTNLFSQQQTLNEKYGTQEMDKALEYASSFYNNVLTD